MSTLGKMARYMMENGTWERNMVLGYGRGVKETLISESGLKVELKGMVSISGRTETDMKVNG